MQQSYPDPYTPYSTHDTEPKYSPVPPQSPPLARALLSGSKPVRGINSLWADQLLAVIAGSITLTLGAMGLASCFERGPLYSTFIPLEVLSGPVINPAMIGALVAGVATLLSAMGTKVVSGVARAWLRRMAVHGRPASVKQWRTLAAGVSIRDARRTPLLAGGLVLAFTVALAIHSSALAGVAIPTARKLRIPTTLPIAVPYLGNGATSQINNCMDVNNNPCVQWLSLPDITNAFRYGMGFGGDASYVAIGTQVINVPGQGFLASVVPTGPTTGVFVRYGIVSPVSRFTTKCTTVSAGVQGGRFYYVDSPCFPTTGSVYGNATHPAGTYSYGDMCTTQGNAHTSMTMTFAMGGWLIDSRTFAVQCTIDGFEGLGEATKVYGSAVVISAPVASTIRTLPTSDMENIGSALLSALSGDQGMNGVATPAQAAMKSAVDATGKIDLVAFANGVSNAWAASAAAGYTILIGDSATRQTLTNGTTVDAYRNMYRNLAAYTTYNGFGWSRTDKLLAFSIVCVIIGLVWFAAAAYMFGGGTQYDPTDWFQTLNTSAGSNLSQIPGTCTGANLDGTAVNNSQLWYGEIAPGHVGFAQQPAARLIKNGVYGSAAQGA